MIPGSFQGPVDDFDTLEPGLGKPAAERADFIGSGRAPSHALRPARKLVQEIVADGLRPSKRVRLAVSQLAATIRGGSLRGRGGCNHADDGGQ